MSIAKTTSARQNRTITLYLGSTLAEYETTYLTEEGIPALLRQVEIADSLDWGCLATGHHSGCPRQLHLGVFQMSWTRPRRSAKGAFFGRNTALETSEVWSFN